MNDYEIIFSGVAITGLTVAAVLIASGIRRIMFALGKEITDSSHEWTPWSSSAASHDNGGYTIYQRRHCTVCGLVDVRTTP